VEKEVKTKKGGDSVLEKQVSTAPFTIDLGKDLFIRGEVHTVLDGIVKPVIILCHGFKGFKDWGFFPYVASELAQQGLNVVKFNFSCNGVADKDFDELDKFSVNTFSREQEDLAVLFCYITTGLLPLSSHFAIDKIGILGHSRGGGNSILFAANQQNIKAVVTWNGIANVDFFDDSLKQQIYRDGIGFILNARTKQQMPMKAIVFEDIEKNKERFDIINHLANLHAPCLVIQGLDDSPRLIQGFHKMKEAAPRQHFLEIPEANHTFGAVHPFQGTTKPLETALNETTSFFKRALLT
jgi:uncharacterized protein